MVTDAEYEDMKKREKEYLESGGNICPFCNSEDITAGPVEFNSIQGFRDCECKTCKEAWQEHYSLSGISEYDKQGNLK
ncbi:MAG: hypothetical protein AABY32_01915 [Nanoarchaeota archaeon]